MLEEIKKDLRKQRRGIQGADANPSRHLKENQLYWLISQAEKAEQFEKEKYFLEDTRDILVGYDGCKTEEQLKGLIDETKARLSAFLNGKIQEYQDSL